MDNVIVKKSSVLGFVVLFALAIYSFFYIKNINSKTTPTSIPTAIPTKEGTNTLEGKVSLVTGNCMPTIGVNNNCKHSFVSRNIYIRESASGDLIKKVESDANGFYQVNLPLGTYSVFVEDGKKEYCNSFDGQGNACQVVIKTGINNYDIEINKAVW